MVLKILFTLKQVLGIFFDVCMPKEGKLLTTELSPNKNSDKFKLSR